MITFQSTQSDFKIKLPGKHKNWLSQLAAKEKREIGTIAYVFMSDAELLEHNINFLQHTTYTDIITFDYCEGKTIHGDILISIERVAENADKYEVDFYTELHRVMSHGLFHLCGYKDKKKADSDLMRKKEESALRLWQKLG